MTKNIFNWNHISSDLTEDKISELKALYKCYHRLFKCYQWKYKKLKRLKLSLEMSAIGLTVTGSVVGAVTLNPIVIGCVNGSGVLIQAYLTKSDLSNRVERCKFAYTSYKKILVQLKSFMRGLEYDEVMILSDLKILDDIIIDQCPGIDSYFNKYNSKFTE